MNLIRKIKKDATTICCCLAMTLLFGCNKSADNPAQITNQNKSDVVTSSIDKMEDARPNVLLIVVDDMGFSDLGSFGGEITTPNLDELAESGVRLTNFHTAATCSPTRAMLMSGIDHHQAGIGIMAETIELFANVENMPGYEGYLNQRVAALPEVLQASGYNTYMAGKWHLGMAEEHSPAARGFDKSFALLEGGSGHFDDLGLTKPKSTYRENGKITTLPEDFYSTKFYTEKMKQYIEEDKESDKPFFAYIAYTAPHWPIQAPDDVIALYEGKYDMGQDKLREQRIQKAIKLGVASENSPTQFDNNAWEGLTQEEKKIEMRKMEIYAAMVHDLDVYIGQLLDFLEASDELDNTAIFFMSDNGAEGWTENSLPPFIPLIKQCCNNEYENMGKGDSYLFVGPDWAKASTGHASGLKGTTSQGGIRAPAIVKYPNMQETNTISSRFASVKDIMPTILDLADIAAPNGTFAGREVLALQGKSMLAQQDEAQAEMGWEYMGHKAYRKGPWKVISVARTPNWSLYNLDDDPGELNDLSEQHPEKLAELVNLWGQYAKENGVIKLQPRRR